MTCSPVRIDAKASLLDLVVGGLVGEVEPGGPHRVLSSTRLRWDIADRVAIALGHHPCELCRVRLGSPIVRRCSASAADERELAKRLLCLPRPGQEERSRRLGVEVVGHHRSSAV